MHVLVLFDTKSNQNVMKFVEGVLSKTLSHVSASSMVVTQQSPHIKVKNKAHWELSSQHVTDFRGRLARFLRDSAVDYVVCCGPIGAQILLMGDFGNIQTTQKIAGTIGTFYSARYIIMNDLVPVVESMIPMDAETRGIERFTAIMYLFQLASKEVTPKFNYFVPASREELQTVINLASKALLIATDIETYSNSINCVGFTLVFSPDMQDAVTFTIPVQWSGSSDLNPWTLQEDLQFAWQTILTILGNDVPKVQKNGMFDATQQMMHGFAMNNWAFDVEVMAWALRPTMPKSLHYLASMFCSDYRYWKDEGKAVDDAGKATYRSPENPTNFHTYLEYCGKDCWYTARLCVYFLKTFFDQKQHKFFLNYMRAYITQIGPCLFANWHGYRLNQPGLEKNHTIGSDMAHKLLDELRLLTACPSFNPLAPRQVGAYVYDVMATPKVPRKGPSTDKKILRLLADMNPVIKPFVQRVEEYKYRRKEYVQYGVDIPQWKGRDGQSHPRTFTQLSTTRTTTSRMSSTKSLVVDDQKRSVGMNLQNVPAEMRGFIEAKPGNVFVFVDLTAADVWHMASACQDPEMIRTVMTPGNDSHSIHAADFFVYDLQDVLAGKKAKAPWVVDEYSGVRPLTKKVVHGTNYGLGAESMVINIGRPSAVAIYQKLLKNERSAPEFITFLQGRGSVITTKDIPRLLETIPLMDIKRLSAGCAFLQMKYFARYKGLRNFVDQVCIDEIANANKVLTINGGYSLRVFGALDDATVKRFCLAAYGQGGTAGNITTSLLRFWLNSDFQRLHDWGFKFVLQVHDELIFEVPREFVTTESLTMLQTMMAVPVTCKGLTFTIPSEIKINRLWSKSGYEWHEGVPEATLREKIGDLK